MKLFSGDAAIYDPYSGAGIMDQKTWILTVLSKVLSGFRWLVLLLVQWQQPCIPLRCSGQTSIWLPPVMCWH